MADLDLTSDKPERPKVIFSDGSKCEMKTVGEFTVPEIKAMQQAEGEDIDDVLPLVKKILVKPTKKQLDLLTIYEIRRIVSFFSQAIDQEVPQNTQKQSPQRKGSTAARRKTG